MEENYHNKLKEITSSIPLYISSNQPTPTLIFEETSYLLDKLIAAPNRDIKPEINSIKESLKKILSSYHLLMLPEQEQIEEYLILLFQVSHDSNEEENINSFISIITSSYPLLYRKIFNKIFKSSDSSSRPSLLSENSHNNISNREITKIVKLISELIRIITIDSYSFRNIIGDYIPDLDTTSYLSGVFWGSFEEYITNNFPTFETPGLMTYTYTKIYSFFNICFEFDRNISFSSLKNIFIPETNLYLRKVLLSSEKTSEVIIRQDNLTPIKNEMFSSSPIELFKFIMKQVDIFLKLPCDLDLMVDLILENCRKALEVYREVKEDEIINGDFERIAILVNNLIVFHDKLDISIKYVSFNDMKVENIKINYERIRNRFVRVKEEIICEAKEVCGAFIDNKVKKDLGVEHSIDDVSSFASGYSFFFIENDEIESFYLGRVYSEAVLIVEENEINEVQELFEMFENFKIFETIDFKSCEEKDSNNFYKRVKNESWFRELINEWINENGVVPGGYPYYN